ncbi:unnamed protein product [Prorocentrum cordatum]|uniref:Uncharacterized protein n=1 Tax=Prorocentrum cordatum TaxID=2364126 RepID=A0ABN9UFJ7_9DINO|nr:unnamed protein product [Polarella glacialis]
MALAGEECTVPSPEPCQEERQAPRASLAAPPPPFGSAAPLAPNPSRARAAERGGLCPMGGACSAEPGRARPTAAGPQLRKLPSPQRRRVGRTGGGRLGWEAAERRSGRAGECGPQRQLRLAPAGSTTSAFLAPPRSRGTSGRGTAPGRPRTRARPAAPWMIGSPPPRPPPPRAGGPGEAKRTRSMPLYVGRALQADVGRFFK